MSRGCWQKGCLVDAVDGFEYCVAHMTSGDLRIWGMPNDRSSAENRIMGCINLLRITENEVTRLGSLVHNIAAHPDVDVITERLDGMVPLIREAVDLLGHLDLTVLFDDDEATA
ncbi:MAG TPA: hypothetical protein VIR57_00090 [Chloroflexota bacterium]